MALPALRLLWLARKGWKRLPPEQRRRLIQGARKRGPDVAKQVGRAIKQARKGR